MYCNCSGLNLSWNSGTQSEGSNLLRMRNMGLGKSAPLLSSSSVRLLRRLFTRSKSTT